MGMDQSSVFSSSARRGCGGAGSGLSYHDLSFLDLLLRHFRRVLQLLLRLKVEHDVPQLLLKVIYFLLSLLFASFDLFVQIVDSGQQFLLILPQTFVHLEYEMSLPIDGGRDQEGIRLSMLYDGKQRLTQRQNAN